MKRFVIILPLLLSACCHISPKPEARIIPKMEYVIKIPPAQLMQLPLKPTKIDVDKSDLKQSDIATFIVGSEEYTTQLENKLIGIAKFFADEQQKLNTQANKENSK